MSIHPEVKAAGVAHEVSSVCMKCFQEGTAKFMLTEIPFFKEILVSSFYCPHCHFSDRGIQSAGSLSGQHATFTLTVDPALQEEHEIQENLSRTIVRTDDSTIAIPEIGFEIQPQRSEIITLEGMLMNIKDSLANEQPKRELEQPEHFAKINEVIEQLDLYLEGIEKFTFIISDPTGNCFITNPNAPAKDAHCIVTLRNRTLEETTYLGFTAQQEAEFQQDQLTQKGMSSEECKTQNREKLIASAMSELNQKLAKKRSEISDKGPERGEQYKSGGSKAALKRLSQAAQGKEELSFAKLAEQNQLQSVVFPEQCHECGGNSETRMCIVDIPYFRSTVIMCTDCVHCGYKDAEVKPGGGIADKGQRMELRLTSTEDLSRDVLKSDFAKLEIPELGLEILNGTLGGKFSTVEGLILDVLEQLKASSSFYTGDSATDFQKSKFSSMLTRIQGLLSLQETFTFVIDDPAGNSFIEGRVNGVHDTDPALDENMTITYYDRTEEQNTFLGVNYLMNDDHTTIKPNDTQASTEEDDSVAEDQE